MFFNRSANYEIQHYDSLCLLTDAVDPTNSLLNNHRIPWQVIVDENRGALKIDTLAANVRCQKHGNVRAFKKIVDRNFTFIDRDAPMDHTVNDLLIAKRLFQVFKRAAKEGENHHLSLWSIRLRILFPNRSQSLNEAIQLGINPGYSIVPSNSFREPSARRS